MHPREEEYPIQRNVSQEQPKPSPLAQVLAALGFAAFIILTPRIIDKLGK